MNKIKHNLYIYLILLIATFLSLYILFKKGIFVGDDFAYHFTSIEAMKEALKNKGNIFILPNMVHNIGYGSGFFYSPISHLVPAYISYIFNIDVVLSLKIMFITLSYFSAICMFHFINNVVKDKTISLIASITYLMMPYLGYDLFIRSAYAETVAYFFLPLFFNSLYLFIHDDKVTMKHLSILVISSALILLSHNLTALYCLVFAIIYLGMNYKTLFSKLKNKRMIIYIILSCISLILLISFQLLNIYLHNKEHIYVVSNSNYMGISYWATFSHGFDAISASGLLGLKRISLTLLPEAYLNAIIYSLITILYLIFVKKSNKRIITLFLISIGYILLVLASLSFKELTICACLTSLFVIICNLLNFNETNNIDKKNKRDFLVLTIITCILIYIPFVWYLLIKPLHYIQFPWRLHSFEIIFAIILISLMIKKGALKLKKAIYVIIAIIPAFSISVAYSNSKATFENNFNEKYYSDYYSLGMQTDYLPLIYSNQYNDEYTPLYQNSLYYDLKNETNKKILTDEVYNARILKGNADIEVLYRYTPTIKMRVKASENTLIQLPLIYYKGYEITITDKNNNVIVEEPYNPAELDYFVGLNLNEGEYLVTVTYKDNKMVKLAFKAIYLGILLLLALIIFDLLFNKIMRKHNYEKK